MPPFDANAYRKRVLAGVEERGGPDTTDPYEVYDLPLDADDDAAVAEQLDAVWACWQKERNNPKYKGLVTALLSRHEEWSDSLRTHEGRVWLRQRVEELRASRSGARTEVLDAAIDRLVERHGGIPRGKVALLQQVAHDAGLDEVAFASRIRRYRVVDDAPVAAERVAIPAAIRQQVRDGLAELGRLTEEPPPVTLFALLGLGPDASREQVAQRAAALAQRNRESRPDRRRAALDDLVTHARALLVDGDPQLYLDAVAEDVSAALRGSVVAAVLVEDRLVADDAAHLIGRALELGLDTRRAEAVVVALARDVGAPVDLPAPGRPPIDPGSRARGDSRDRVMLEALLKDARSSLRAGRLIEARDIVVQAAAAAGERGAPLRALSDEIDARLTEAHVRWRAAVSAIRERRLIAASEQLTWLVRSAGDVLGPEGALPVAAFGALTATIEDVERRFAAAREQPSVRAREAALLALVEVVVDHEGVRAVLAAIEVQPPLRVTARAVRGGVRVAWNASPSTGPIDYKVARVTETGTQPVGTTPGLSIEDGGVPSGELPVYTVTARRAGVLSAPASSAESGASSVAPSAPPATPPTTRPVDPPEVTATTDGSVVRLTWSALAAHAGHWVERVELGADGAEVARRRLSIDADGYRDRQVRAGATYRYTLYVGALASAPVTVTVGGPVVVDPSAVAVDPAPAPGITVADIAPIPVAMFDGTVLRFVWPHGCTEALVLWRRDVAPQSAADRAALRRKVTNTKYQLDGGTRLPDGAEPVGHVAVFACTRNAGGELVAAERAAHVDLEADKDV